MSARRINHGRGHRYELDGIERPGATTILGDGYPKPALINWAANETAAYAINHWDELAAMDVAQRLRTLEKARWINRDSAAVRGTDVHALAHRLAAGEEVEPPEHLIGFVDAYLKFVDEWHPRELIVEAVVGNREWRYLGTLDLVADLADENRWLLDWKTGGKGIYKEAALQLSAYRHAEFYIGVDGVEHPVPQVDEAGCVWLRDDGTYDLVPVDAGPDTFRTFLYVSQVARFVNDASPVREALPPPGGNA